MSEAEKKGLSDYNKFDEMSSDVLRAILQADFEAPEADRMDVAAIMYISDLLAKRRKEDPALTQIDTAAAKAEFYREYYPLKDNRELIQDIIAEAEEQNIAPGKQKHHVSGQKSIYKKIAGIAAAVLLILCLGSVTAYAFGFGPIAKWNESRFWFETEPVTAELASVAADFNSEKKLVPKWLPDGYEFESVDIVNYSDINKINSSFVKNTEDGIFNIYIDYAWNNVYGHLTYEKTDKDAVKYEKNGIDHYIITNSNNITIVWLNGDFECSITGKITESEAKKIINSIY